MLKDPEFNPHLWKFDAPANASANDHDVCSEHGHSVAATSIFEGGHSRRALVDLPLDVTARDDDSPETVRRSTQVVHNSLIGADWWTSDLTVQPDRPRQIMHELRCDHSAPFTADWICDDFLL